MASFQEETGLRSLELRYEPVLHAEFGTTVAYRSQLRLNSADMGVLLPQQYLPVALRSAQGNRLALMALDIAADAVANLKRREVYFEWLSVLIPSRLLLDDSFQDAVDRILARGIQGRELCLELLPELLYEDAAQVKPVLDALRQKGIRMMLGGFGDAFSPVMRLREFPVDMVLLDACVTADLQDEQRRETASLLLEMVLSGGREAIACGVDTADMMKQFSALGCSLSVGKLAGKHRKLMGIRA